MENIPIKLENILEQAPNWTFAGDFTLLQWMNKISQDLESRANTTTDALSKLNHNVRSTNIALDNVANSLTTLQFGNQFVECRVQDDDETLPIANETNSEGSNKIEEIPSSKEMLKIFLDNNLKILRNCHEKYSLDLDDSDDDEEGPKEKTCIYQPINPYNDRPLPFIFGSKDWHAKWHVGLYENQQDNSYSGDEISETFSDSSANSPTDDNESFESNTEWASSNSIDNENINTNIEVRNASSLKGSQPIFPGTTSIPIKIGKANALISDSSTLSTPSSSSLARAPIQNKKQQEILNQRSESISSINSKTSIKNPTKSKTLIQENPYGNRTKPPAFVDLFAEPPEDIESTASSSVSSIQHTKRSSQDFIETQTKPINTQTPTGFKKQPPVFVDLFAEPPEDFESSTPSSLSSTQNIKRKPVNLFDDDDDDDDVKDNLLPVQTKPVVLEKANKEAERFVKPNEFYEDDLLPVQTKKKNIDQSRNVAESSKKTQTPPKVVVKDKPLNVSITPKSLFDDDDDEDDDFLKAFVKSSKTTNNSSLTKSLLFDNDLTTESPKVSVKTNEPKENQFQKATSSKETKTNKINLFDDLEDDDSSLFGNSNKNKISLDKSIQKASALKVATGFDELDKKNQRGETIKKPVNIFDDLEKEDLKQDSVSGKPVKTPKKLNLFDDMDDEEDENDIFATKPKSILNKISSPKKVEILTNQSIVEEKGKDQGYVAKENIKPKILTKSEKEFETDSKSVDIIKEKENTNTTDISSKAAISSILQENVTKSFEESAEINKNLYEKVSGKHTKLDQEIAIKPITTPILQENVTKSSEEIAEINQNLNENVSRKQTNKLDQEVAIKSLINTPTLQDNFTKSSEETSKINKNSKENVSNLDQEDLSKQKVKADHGNKSIKDLANKDKGQENKISKNFQDISKPQVQASKPLKESINQKVETKSNEASGADKNKTNTPELVTKDESQEKQLGKNYDEILNSKKPQVSAYKPLKESVKEVTVDKSQEEQNNTTSTNTQSKTSLQNEQISSESIAFENSEIPPPLNDESSTSTNKYDFNSILFLDEPPDDDSEFFETLTKSPQTMNTKYNTIDLEHDLYEPDLPKVPPAVNTTITQTDLPENRSLYTGLQLFSDIPPDDVDEDEKAVVDQLSSVNSTHPKRLHSVFYDDLNETLMAINKNQKDQAVSNLKENIAILKTNKESAVLREEEKEKTISVSTNKDVVDHETVSQKPNVVSEVKSSLTASTKRPVSKLQMPNININVQALLPGSNTTLRKAKEDTKRTPETEVEKVRVLDTTKKMEESLQVSKKESFVNTKKESVEVPRTAETEHILPSVTKNRVRAPISRRPSTRKARQDNYRQSLIEQEQQASGETEDIETIKIENKTINQLPTKVVEIKDKPQLKVNNTQKMVDDNRNDTSEIFKKIKMPTKSNIPNETIKKTTTAVKQQSLKVNQPSKDLAKTKDAPKQSSSKENKSLFQDDEEDDFSLFNVTKTSPKEVSTKKENKTLNDPTPNVNIESSNELKKSSIQKEDKSTKDLSSKDNNETSNVLEIKTPLSSLPCESTNKLEHTDTFKNIKSKHSENSLKKDSTNDKIKSSIPKVDKKPTSSLLFDDEEDDDNDFFKNIKTSNTKVIAENTTKAYLSFKENSDKKSSPESFIPTEDTKPKTPLLFENQEEQSIKTSKIPKTKEEITNTSAPSKISNTADLPSLNKNQEQIPKLLPQKEHLKPVKNFKSFLDDEDEDVDDLFATSNLIKSLTKPVSNHSENTPTVLDDKNQKTSTTITKNVPIQTNPLNNTKPLNSSNPKELNKKSKFSSYLDSESDEDLPVAGLQTTKTIHSSKPTPSPALSSQTSSQQKSSSTPSTKSSSSKLFTDSDTDSEDLFGKSSFNKTTQKPLNKPNVSKETQAVSVPKTFDKKPPTSIFSDDSDGDDDFLKASGSATKKLIPKSSSKENKAKVAPPTSASIFSDIDSDEDDLFGGGVNKTAKAPAIQTSKISATNQPVDTTIQSSKTKTISDNPLADLL